MAIVKSPGLVLQRIPFGDTSLILKVYTADHGLLTLMAKGARHPRSKFRALTDFFLLVQWVHPISSRGEMLSLHDASLMEDMPSLRTEPIKQALAQVWLEIFLRLSPASGESNQRFDWLMQHLQSLDVSTRISEAQPLAIDFLAGFCALSGFAPQFRECAVCGCPCDAKSPQHPVGKLRMHLDMGGPICSLCSKEGGEMMGLHASAARLIECAQEFGISALSFNKATLQAAEQFLWSFLERHATEGRRLKALEVYRTMTSPLSRSATSPSPA
jgi:DNA repair protein RecO (recombination protein O)